MIIVTKLILLLLIILIIILIIIVLKCSNNKKGIVDGKIIIDSPRSINIKTPPKIWDIWCFSGGGTRAMSQAIGLTFGLASIYNKNSDKIFNGAKIIAANSGGSWFLSMLGYSPSFNSMINKVSQGSSPSDIYNKLYVQKLRNLNLPIHYNTTTNILKLLGLTSTIDNIEGELYEFKKFINIPWFNVIRDWIFKPFNNELDTVKLTDIINPIVKNKSIIFCSGLLTSAMVGATDAAKLTGLKYALDTPFIKYDINGHKNPKTSVIPIMFSNNQPWFLSYGKINVTYNAFTYQNIGTDITTSITQQLQQMNSNTTVVGASSSSSAAVGFLSSEHFINSLFQRLWSGNSNSYETWLIGNWLTEYLRNFSPALTIYSNVQDKQQGCRTNDDCVTENWYRPVCVCRSEQNCPDAPFKGFNDPPNDTCQRNLSLNCVCNNKNNSISQNKGSPIITINGQFNAGNSYQSTEAAARIALRTMDGGLLDNSSISYSIRGYQKLYSNNKKIRIFALSSTQEETFIVNENGALCSVDLSYLFGFGHDGKKIPLNTSFIDYLAVSGTGSIAKITQHASKVLLVPNPTIFKYENAKPIYMYPKNKDFISHGNTKCKIMKYNTTTINNNNFGIVEGFQIELTVLMVVSKNAGDIPITSENFNAMTEIVDDIFNILKKDINIRNEIMPL